MKNIPDQELLAMASEFDLGPEPIVNGRAFWWEEHPLDEKMYHITVKNMGNPDEGGPDRWGIFQHSNTCLNKVGEWEYQSLPSSRPEDFYERCRFDSVHEAIAYYRRWKVAIEKWAKEKMAAVKEGERVILNYDDCPKELLKFEK